MFHRHLPALLIPILWATFPLPSRAQGASSSPDGPERLRALESRTAGGAEPSGERGEGPAPTPEPARNFDDPRKQEILNRLSSMKIDLDFADTPLADVLDFIRDFAQINLVMDPRTAEQAAGDDMKVTIKVRELALKSALKLILQSKGLTAVYRDGVLLVLPQEEAKKSVVLRIYDVRDLLAQIQDFPGPVVELKPPGQEGGGGISGATFSLEESKSIITEDFLTEMIKTHTGGGDWDSNPSASIQLSNGLLMVTQTKGVHAEVEVLLGKLRAFK